MIKQLLAAGVALSIGSAWAQEMKVEFADPAWDGKRVPEAHNCNSATAATPPLKISGLPSGSDYVTLSFRDIDGPGQMSADGGHGRLGFFIKAGSAEITLPAIQQGKGEGEMPEGVELLGEHMGRRPVSGYLAPCSQGRNNRYEVTVRAVTAADKNKALAETKVPIGNW